MSWYYADNGRQAGPIDDATLDNLMRQGGISPDTLVWKEGMPNWQPLSTVRPAAAPIPAPPPPAPVQPSYTPPTPSYSQPQQPQNDPFANLGANIGQGFQQAGQSIQQGFQQNFGGGQQQQQGVTCANCGQQFPMSDVVYLGNGYVCANCKPAYMQRMREGGGSMAGSGQTAPLGKRFVAYIIDVIIVMIAQYAIIIPLTILVATIDSTGVATLIVSILNFFLIFLFWPAYNGYFLSKSGATLGKQMMGMQVVRSNGGPISFQRGIGRGFAAMIPFSQLVGLFTEQNKAIHDYVCDTRVVAK